MRKQHMRSRVVVVGAIAITGCLLLAGCPNQTVRDLEGIPVKDPQKVELYVSVDKYPNVTAMCINGAGFASTTRDNSQAALQHIPTWDAPDGWCGTGKVPQ